MNIYSRIQKCRVALQKTNLKKSGRNGHLGFNYFTLDDFIFRVNELFLENDLFSAFSIVTTPEGVREAELVIYYKPEGKDMESVRFCSPIADAGLKSSTPIQSLGAVHTYMRRYLYVNALEITEPEILDMLAGTDEIETGETKVKPLNPALVDEATSIKLTLEKVATYLKKEVHELTDEDLMLGIKKQREAIAKAMAKKTQKTE